MTFMTTTKNTSLMRTLHFKFTVLAALAAVMLPVLANAQYFDYSSSGSGRAALLAGFRKPGVASYELVVNLGNVTNLLAQPEGSTTAIGSFSPSQLTAAIGTYGSLSWSVMGTYKGPEFNSWAGYRGSTIWFTLPRSSVGTQTTPPARRSYSSQTSVMNSVDSIGTGAASISVSLGTADSNNTTNLVREPAGNGNGLSLFMDQPGTGLLDNMPATIENVTPSSFVSAVRSDLYQSVPTSYNDPVTGTNNGSAYYVGYFTLNTDGTMTFTRASSTVTPPAPQIVKITRSGNDSTVFFTTTNGFTYSLRYTNSAGLTAPVANWPVLGITATGDGTTNQLTDTTADVNRFYRVSAQ